MPRYIDAEGLNLYDDLFMKGKNDSGVWVRYRDVERLIRNAPTADVEEVKHGKIIKTGRRYPYCSECKCNVSTLFDRCPWCGAKMSGKEKTNTGM